MYGEVKKDIGEILRKLCDMSEAKLLEGTVAQTTFICILQYLLS